MLRRLVVAVGLCVLVALGSAPAGWAHEAPQTPTTSGPPARAWVLVDADSGAVLAALNHHEPLYIASLVKVMTAFVTMEQLQMDNDVPVSPLAASKPAMRIGMEAGQTWTLEHALHSLLMVSANDAAFALAEASAGSVEEFANLMQRTGKRLGMTDSTWLDPAGFNGEEGFGGGTRASAYDLGILARNALEVPEIMAIAGKQTYEFHGGDGLDHTLTNHNKMLVTYPGITGLKTGYTRAAGHTFIGTATRDGRRLVAVVLDAKVKAYDVAAALLDQGFATPADAEGTGEVLPAVSFSRAEAPPVEAEPEEVAETTAAAGEGSSALRRLGTLVLLAVTVAFFGRREQIKRRKRRRRAMRRAYLDAKRRGMIDVIDANRYYGPGSQEPGGSSHLKVHAPRGRRPVHATHEHAAREHARDGDGRTPSPSRR